MTDILDRLSKPVHDGWNGKRMKEWDLWRKAIAEDDAGSWPRDAFESLLDAIDEEREEAAAEIRRLREIEKQQEEGR